MQKGNIARLLVDLPNMDDGRKKLLYPSSCFNVHNDSRSMEINSSVYAYGFFLTSLTYVKSEYMILVFVNKKDFSHPFGFPGWFLCTSCALPKRAFLKVFFHSDGCFRLVSNVATVTF